MTNDGTEYRMQGTEYTFDDGRTETWTAVIDVMGQNGNIEHIRIDRVFARPGDALVLRRDDHGRMVAYLRLADGSEATLAVATIIQVVGRPPTDATGATE